MPSSTILGQTWTNQYLVDNFVNPQWIRKRVDGRIRYEYAVIT